MSLEIFGSKESEFGGSFTDEGEHAARLLPCPFCGGSADLEIKNTHTPYYWVDCNNCGAQCSPAMPAYRGRIRTEVRARRLHEAAIEAAIAGWNTRAAAPTTSGGE